MCMTNYMRSCLFLHAHFYEKMKVVEYLFKKRMVKNSFIEKHMLYVHIGIASIIEAIPMCTYNICY